LVPQSGIQFLDIRFNIGKLPRLTRMYWEQPLPPGSEPGDSNQLVNLRVLQERDGGFLDPVSGQSPPDDEIYAVGRPEALQPFLNSWVPLPYFGVAAVGAGGAAVYANGPTNWARIRIVPLREPDDEGNTHHAVLAFDTTLGPRDPRQPYTTLSPEDSKSAGEFALLSDRETLGWYLVMPWLAQWLEESFRDMQKGPQLGGRACEHWARYLCFLVLLAQSDLMPRVRLVDVVSESRSYDPISVDLVLGIGNTRTCGILVEDDRATRLNLNNSYPLQLRDLGRPEQT
jgi:hypothetical protein